MKTRMEETDGIPYNEWVEEISNQAAKYEDLVWYARRPSADDNYWDEVSEDIKKQAFDQMKRVEKEFPDEVQKLRDSEMGNQTHNFNRGCLAAFRFAYTVMDPTVEVDEETGEKFLEGGIEAARERFPDLDS